jgi:hypothetical protein
MKPTLPTLLRASLVALPCCLVTACGSAHRDGGSAASVASALPALPGDEDRDNAGRREYFDGDDGSIRYFGHAASAQDARAVAALVRRYYAAAAAGDGARACALIYYLVAETLPEEYARPPGPEYLKGADSCPALLSRVFAHFRAQLAISPTVTAVRVDRDHADALLGWKGLPAGYLAARREGRVWRLNAPLASPLP